MPCFPCPTPLHPQDSANLLQFHKIDLVVSVLVKLHGQVLHLFRHFGAGAFGLLAAPAFIIPITFQLSRGHCRVNTLSLSPNEVGRLDEKKQVWLDVEQCSRIAGAPWS